MTFSISDIKSYANGKGGGGFGRSTHYSVTFSLPTGSNSAMAKYTSSLTDLTFSASAVNIPSIGITTSVVKRGGSSYNEYFPTNTEFGPVNVTFLSDSEGTIMQFLRDWIDSIYETDDTQSGAYQVAYSDDYKGGMQINHYDSTGNLIMLYEFFEIWPEQLSDVELSWASFDNIITLPVQFRYKKYTQTKNGTNSVSINYNGLTGAQQNALITGISQAPIIGS